MFLKTLFYIDFLIIVSFQDFQSCDMTVYIYESKNQIQYVNTYLSFELQEFQIFGNTTDQSHYFLPLHTVLINQIEIQNVINLS